MSFYLTIHFKQITMNKYILKKKFDFDFRLRGYLNRRIYLEHLKFRNQDF